MAPRLPRVFLAPRVKLAVAAAADARNNEGFFGAERLSCSDSDRWPQTLKATKGRPPFSLAPPCWKNGGKFGLIDDIRWSEDANPPLLGVLLRSSKSRVNKTPGQIAVGLNSLQRQTIGSQSDHRVSSICPNSGVVFQQARLSEGVRWGMRTAESENNGERSTGKAGKLG